MKSVPHLALACTLVFAAMGCGSGAHTGFTSPDASTGGGNDAQVLAEVLDALAGWIEANR